MRNIKTMLLCEWAQGGTPPPAESFEYTPSDVAIEWIDSLGIHTGDLAAFNATANKPTVTELHMDGLGITSISNLSSLPSLVILRCQNNLILSLDASNCVALTMLYCFNNPISSLNVNGCLSLGTLVAEFCNLATLDVTTCTALTYLDAAVNSITTIDLTNNLALVVVLLSENLLTGLNLSNNVLLSLVSVSINYFSVNAVNTILVAIATGAAFTFTLFGEIDIDGQLPAGAIPDSGPPDGAAAASALVNLLFWNVVTDV